MADEVNLHRILDTDQQVDIIFPRNWTRGAAENRKRRILALAKLPDYELIIERRGFLNYRVVPYAKEGTGPGNGFWTCHVCGARRPDAQISVLSDSKPILGGRSDMEVNVRYCNDRKKCIDGAPHEVRRRLHGSTNDSQEF